MYIIILLLLFVLIFRLAVLTIVQGEVYRTEADIKTIRDIPIKAPRGNIYDRNGVLLAGNIPSFTVQIRKDEIDYNSFDETALLLANILDRNNEKIIDEFPIELNSIVFDSDTNNTEYYYPEEMVESLIISNDLVEEVIGDTDSFVSKVDLKARILLIIDKEIENFPVIIKDGEYQFKTGVESDISAQQVLIDTIYSNSRLIRKFLTNSELRIYIFNILYKNDLVKGLELIPYTFTYDNQFHEIKKDLVTKSENIKFDTDAKSDFSFLVRLYCSDSFFRDIYKSKDGNIIPGVLLYDKVKATYPALPVVYSIDSVQNTVYFNFTNNEDKNNFIKEKGYTDEVTAYDILLEYAVKDNLDFEIYTLDEVKYFAQEKLLKYINPSISVASWDYTPILKKLNWIRANLGKVESANVSAQVVFSDLKASSKFGEDASDYISREVFAIQERYVKQGYLAYHPIDICYGISEKTIALLSENSDKLKGIEIVVEPLRYYPYKESAAHVLGYLGKISQDYEIEKYIKEENYSQDDLIGKTGVEESFESLLNGEKGSETLKVDVYGNRISSVKTGLPIPGDNLYLTIDINLQQNAEKYLKKALDLIRVGGVYDSQWGDFKFDATYKNAVTGALVALDVNTGEVLAMANYPSYDPNLFSTGITQQDWQSLLNESKDPLAPKPLYNISMLTAIQPGSTFKIITALAALEKGLSPNEKIYDAGYMEIGGQTFGCWIWNMYKSIHGYENMYEAIRDSCNFYFYTVVLGENKVTKEKTSVKVGLTDILSIAKQFGLNDKAGIEIQVPGEVSGGVPDPETKINSIKYFLKKYLSEQIENYYVTGVSFNPDEKIQLINEIVSWVNGNEPLTRTEVYEKSIELNLNPEKIDDNGTPFVDIIKYSYLNQAVWNDGDTMNISIGQGSNSYTPLQMANFIATVANGGYLHNISVIGRGTNFNNTITTYVPERNSDRVELKDYKYLDEVTKGMVMVSDSSNIYKKFPVTVASKTGTAEKDGINPETGENYNEFAWYVAFAPAEKPQIAIAIVLFQGGSGRFPAPIARDLIGDYLKLTPLIN